MSTSCKLYKENNAQVYLVGPWGEKSRARGAHYGGKIFVFAPYPIWEPIHRLVYLISRCEIAWGVSPVSDWHCDCKHLCYRPCEAGMFARNFEKKKKKIGQLN